MLGQSRGGVSGRLDTGNETADTVGMSAFHLTVAVAIRLAGRRGGTTAPELSEVAGCSDRLARRTLAVLARDGVLVAEVPERRGKRLGDWRTVYRLTRERG